MFKVYLVECCVTNKQWVIKAICKTHARELIVKNKEYEYDYFNSEFYVNELFGLNKEEIVIDITKED